MLNDKAIQDPTLAAIERHFEAGTWTHADLEFLYRQARLVPEMLEVLETIENDANTVPDWLWKRIQEIVRKARGVIR